MDTWSINCSQEIEDFNTLEQGGCKIHPESTIHPRRISLLQVNSQGTRAGLAVKMTRFLPWLFDLWQQSSNSDDIHLVEGSAGFNEPYLPGFWEAKERK